MKDFFLLVIVCIVIIGGVGWLLLPGPIGSLLHPTVSVAPSKPTPEKASATPPEAPVKKSVPPKKIETPALTAVAPATAVRPAPAREAPVRLPSPWEVLPGEERSAVVERYGDPTLSASTMDTGHLFETYVYRSDRYQSIIHLEDGRVLGVDLKASPRLTLR